MHQNTTYRLVCPNFFVVALLIIELSKLHVKIKSEEANLTKLRVLPWCCRLQDPPKMLSLKQIEQRKLARHRHSFY